MKIELDELFRTKYKQGYLNINKEPRRLVLLVDFNGNKTTISYARYLYSVHINRFLSSDEHVDHINGDKLDDRIENLQILSQIENNRKSVIQNNKNRVIEFKCPICGKHFNRRASNFNYRIDFIPTCSRRCGGIKSHMK